MIAILIPVSLLNFFFGTIFIITFPAFDMKLLIYFEFNGFLTAL